GYSRGAVDVLFLKPQFVRGDFDRNGVVNVADISAMMGALVDISGYQTAKSLTDIQLMADADVNGDAVITNADIQGLIHLLISGVGAGQDPISNAVADRSASGGTASVSRPAKPTTSDELIFRNENPKAPSSVVGTESDFSAGDG